MEQTNEANNPPQRKEECRDYKRNVCLKGDSCKYYHPPKDANSIFERNSVCHDFQNPKGCQRDSCKFLHLTKEQEDYIKANGTCPPSLSQQEMDKIVGLPPFCNDFIRGTCTRGASCKFRHVGEPMPPPGPTRGGAGRGPPERFDPYRRPLIDDPYDRLEMKRRYREDMMEDEIMYLRAQVSRLKRQIADFAATNESLLDENARLRLEVDRNRAAAPMREAANQRLATLPQSRTAAEYSLTQTRSAYPYTSGLKLEPTSASNMAPVTYPTTAHF